MYGASSHRGCINEHNITHNNMVEAKAIIDCIIRDKKSAYQRAKRSEGAYTMRGKSIVKVSQDGSVEVIKELDQAKVRISKEEKVIVLG